MLQHTVDTPSTPSINWKHKLCGSKEASEWLHGAILGAFGAIPQQYANTNAWDLKGHCGKHR